MKTRIQFLPIASLAALAIATVSADATTTLTGVVPTATNSSVPADHGSNELATPNIALNWVGNWDQYSKWDGAAMSTRSKIHPLPLRSKLFSFRIQATPSILSPSILMNGLEVGI